MTDETKLLQQFVAANDQNAFAEIVHRHIRTVYGTARRTTSDPSAAEDITQSVFVLLARQAKKLSRHPALVGWLHRTATLQALNHRRQEQRRHLKEQAAAQTLSQPMEPSSNNDLDHLATEIDRVLLTLRETDRHVVLMRYFENRPWLDISRRLKLSEGASKMRLKRALEKLRLRWAKEGVVLPAAALVGILEAQAQTQPSAIDLSRIEQEILGAIPSPVATLPFLPFLRGAALAFVGVVLCVTIFFLHHHSDPTLETLPLTQLSPSETRSTQAEAPAGPTKRLFPFANPSSNWQADAALRAAVFDRSHVYATALENVTQAIALYGTDKSTAIPILIEALQIPIESGKWSQRITDTFWNCKPHDLALHGLKLLGPDARSVLPFLLERLSADKFYSQSSYVPVIAALDPPPTIAPQLISAMSARYFTENVMGTSLCELAAEYARQDERLLTEAISSLSSLLVSHHPTHRVMAAYTLSLLDTENAFPYLENELLTHLDVPSLQQTPPAPELTDVQSYMRAIMSQTADDGDAEGRRHMALLGLKQLGNTTENAVAPLKQIAEHSTLSRTVNAALSALNAISPELRQDFEPLDFFLDNRSRGTELNDTIREGQANNGTLIEGLRWPNSAEAAAHTIRQQEGEREWAIPHLVDAVRTQRLESKDAIVEAIVDINPRALLDSFTPGKYPDATVLSHLARLGPEAEWAYDELLKFRNEQPQRPSNIDRVLRHIKPASLEPIPTYNLLEPTVAWYRELQTTVSAAQRQAIWDILYHQGPNISVLTSVGVQNLVNEIAGVDQTLANKLQVLIHTEFSTLRATAQSPSTALQQDL